MLNCRSLASLSSWLSLANLSCWAVLSHPNLASLFSWLSCWRIEARLTLSLSWCLRSRFLFAPLSPLNIVVTVQSSLLDPSGSAFYGALLFAPLSPLNVMQSSLLDPSASAFYGALLSAPLSPAHGELSLSLSCLCRRQSCDSLSRLRRRQSCDAPPSSVDETDGGSMLNSDRKYASVKQIAMCTSLYVRKHRPYTTYGQHEYIGRISSTAQ